MSGSPARLDNFRPLGAAPSTNGQYGFAFRSIEPPDDRGIIHAYPGEGPQQNGLQALAISG